MRNSWNDVAAVVQERVSASNGDNAAPDLYYGGGAIFGGGKIFRRGRWGCSETHCPEEIFPTRCVTRKCPPSELTGRWVAAGLPDDFSIVVLHRKVRWWNVHALGGRCAKVGRNPRL